MADQIRMTQGLQLMSPATMQVADYAANVALLAAEKAVANAATPATYPLPAAPDALEHLFAARFKTLPAAKRAVATPRVLQSVNAPRAQREQLFGKQLAQVDLRAATSVAAQASKHFPTVEITHKASSPAAAPLAAAQPAAAVQRRKVALRLNKVRCVDETGTKWSEWAGDDEIYFGGAAVDGSADVSAMTTFKVGDFDDGDVRKFQPPHRIALFDLTKSHEWPQYVQGVLCLSERDSGDFPQWVAKLVQKIGGILTEKLQGAAPDDFADVIKDAVAWAVGKVIKYLGRLWGDENFLPVTVGLEIPKAGLTWGGKLESPEMIAIVQGFDADYRLSYSWGFSPN